MFKRPSTMVGMLMGGGCLGLLFKGSKLPFGRPTLMEKASKEKEGIFYMTD